MSEKDLKPAEGEVKPAEEAPKEDFSVENLHKPKETETVPLSKFMEEKKGRQALQSELIELRKAGDNLSNDTLDELLKKYEDVDPGYSKGLVKAAKSEMLAEIKPMIDKLVTERSLDQSTSDFNKAYDALIAPKYGDQISREALKNLAFDENNRPLKTLDGIIEFYYPMVKPLETKEVNEEVIEGGSKPTPKAEAIDFASMDAETHAKVLADSNLRKQYYDFKDGQSM